MVQRSIKTLLHNMYKDGPLSIFVQKSTIYSLGLTFAEENSMKKKSSNQSIPEILHGHSEAVQDLSVNSVILKVNKVHLFSDLLDSGF